MGILKYSMKNNKINDNNESSINLNLNPKEIKIKSF